MTQQARGRGFVGEEFDDKIGAVIDRAGAQHVARGIAFKQAGAADVAPGAVRVGEQFGKQGGTFQAEVEAVRGDRVHTDGGVPHQRAALAVETAGVHSDERVGVQGAGQRHGAQTAFKHFFNLGGEHLGRLFVEVVRQLAVERDHAVGEFFFQRQQRQRAPVVEAFKGGVFVGFGVAHPEDDDGAAKIVHVRRNAELVADVGKAAIGGDNQAGAVRRAIVKRDVDVFGGDLYVAHCFVAVQGDFRQGFHLLPGGAADVVVGNQKAQRVGRFATGAAGLREMQLLAGTAIEHARIAQFVDFTFRHARPHAQFLHGLARKVGERDFAPVIGRVLQHGERVFFKDRDAQPGTGQRAAETQPRRPRADNDDVTGGIRNGFLGGHGKLLVSARRKWPDTRWDFTAPTQWSGGRFSPCASVGAPEGT